MWWAQLPFPVAGAQRARAPTGSEPRAISKDPSSCPKLSASFLEKQEKPLNGIKKRPGFYNSELCLRPSSGVWVVGWGGLSAAARVCGARGCARTWGVSEGLQRDGWDWGLAEFLDELSLMCVTRVK